LPSAIDLRPDKAESYALYDFFLIFRDAIKVWEKNNMNTPLIQLIRQKVDRKQIKEFGNNLVNKLIALHFTTLSKFLKMWESL